MQICDCPMSGTHLTLRKTGEKVQFLYENGEKVGSEVHKQDVD